MSGLIILFVLGLWGTASFLLARFIVKPIKITGIKVGVNIVLAAFLFIAPVADDIIGGFQFRALCSENAVVVVDEKEARGKIVYLEPRRTDLMNYILPINNYHLDYRDIDTGKVLLSWNEYSATGGWLSRLIGFPEGSPPYTVDGSCYPKNVFGKKNIFDQLDIKKR